ncbi:MAG: DUF4040 domain-containing protein [Salinarimonas sp.]|nr:DUF4040 domain-containing protein [Salinarimonas sp.]
MEARPLSVTLALALGLIGSILAPFAAARWKTIGNALVVAVPALLFIFFFLQLGAVGEAPIVEENPWVPSLGIALTIRLDGFSLLFALLISGIGTLVALYAASYMDEKTPFYRAQFLFYILLFMSAMLATVTADNLMALFVFWEMTSLLSFLLVGFDSTKLAARKAALQSMLVTVGGGLSLLAGIILIGVTAGTFSIGALMENPAPLVESPLFTAIIILMMAGAFTKSAQVPFHFWLPNAMAAPTPASAYLHSATMVKLGVFLLATMAPIFSQAAWFGPTLVAFGGATMLIAALQALRSTAFKAVLAFSTVASLGTITMLIGLDGEVAAVATVGFILAHALYKAALFFCAGIVIHATGEPRLNRLGGLASVMPITAGATVLAAFSAAGLPPFVGFISKEYLFEAQIESTFTAIAVLIGVLVNTVMVAIAVVVVMRPFFRPARRELHVHHGEATGMTVGPVALGLIGLLFGLAPGLVATSLIQPAASAIYGEPLDVSFYLWHGFTPMLALSILVVALGLLVAKYWDPIHVALRRRRIFDRLLDDRGYYWVLDNTLALARWSTLRLQNGDLRIYTAVIATVVTFFMVYALLAGDGPVFPSVNHPEFNLYMVGVVGLIIVGCFVAALTTSLVTAIIGVGLAGYGLALVFLLNGGPDLALTQFSVETLFVVIVTAVLLRLPLMFTKTRTPGERRYDASLAAVFALTIFSAVLWVEAVPFNPVIPEYFAQVSYTEAFGRNVVNVVLVDFRALDTFGEIAVVAFAALGAWALLRRNNVAKKKPAATPAKEG